jgi:hypothetical protein
MRSLILKNSAKFWMYLFSTSWQETFFRFSWEIPQTLLGVFFAHGIFLLCRPSIYKIEGSVILHYASPFVYGVALGSIIIGTFHPQKDFEFLAHEYGHTLQSKILGPLYLPVIGIPSLVSAAFFSSSHFQRWFEKDATRRGKQKLAQKVISLNASKLSN